MSPRVHVSRKAGQTLGEDSDLGLPVWDVGILTGIFAIRPNAHLHCLSLPLALQTVSREILACLVHPSSQSLHQLLV